MFGLFQGIANAINAGSANKSLSRLQKLDPSYAANPLASQYLNLSKNMFYGRMPGAAEQQRGIYTNNANYNNQVQRNASSGSQALSLAAAGQGQSDAALSDLQLKEQQSKMGLLDNLNQAYGQSIREGDKVYQDNIRRYDNLAAIRGAQAKNRNNALNGIFQGAESDVNQVLGLFGGGVFG